MTDRPRQSAERTDESQAPELHNAEQDDEQDEMHGTDRAGTEDQAVRDRAMEVVVGVAHEGPVQGHVDDEEHVRRRLEPGPHAGRGVGGEPDQHGDQRDMEQDEAVAPPPVGPRSARRAGRARKRAPAHAPLACAPLEVSGPASNAPCNC